jgi:Tfp pilus assembly protein PilF
MKQNVLGIDHPSVAVVQNNLAGLLYSSREYDEAVALFRESLRIRQTIYGEFHPLVAESMNNLSVALLSRGHNEESKVHFDRSLEIMTRCYSELHPTVVAAKQRRVEALKAVGKFSDDTCNLLGTFSISMFPSIS